MTVLLKFHKAIRPARGHKVFKERYPIVRHSNFNNRAMIRRKHREWQSRPVGTHDHIRPPERQCLSVERRRERPVKYVHDAFKLLAYLVQHSPQSPLRPRIKRPPFSDFPRDVHNTGQPHSMRFARSRRSSPEHKVGDCKRVRRQRMRHRLLLLPSWRNLWIRKCKTVGMRRYDGCASDTYTVCAPLINEVIHVSHDMDLDPTTLEQVVQQSWMKRETFLIAVSVWIGRRALGIKTEECVCRSNYYDWRYSTFRPESGRISVAIS